jgi:hypothetical protein
MSTIYIYVCVLYKYYMYNIYNIHIYIYEYMYYITLSTPKTTPSEQRIPTTVLLLDTAFPAYST